MTNVLALLILVIGAWSLVILLVRPVYFRFSVNVV